MVVLVCLDTQNPPIKMSHAWKILLVMLVLDLGFLLANFIGRIIVGHLNGFTPLVTSFVSISNGVIFAFSAILLHQYIRNHPLIDNRMKEVVT